MRLKILHCIAKVLGLHVKVAGMPFGVAAINPMTVDQTSATAYIPQTDMRPSDAEGA